MFFFSSRRRHTRLQGDWSSDVCSSDLDLPTHELVKSTAHKPESLIKLALWIADPFSIFHSVISKEFSRLLFSAHVHERQLRSPGCNGGSLLFNLRHRLPTEGSTKVGPKNEQQRIRFTHFGQWPSP